MNKNITEDYVSFETAKFLKEKGFPQELGEEGCVNTIPYYTQNGELVTCDINTMRQKYYPEVAAPTLQMAMKWLRDIKEFIVTIDYDEYELLSDEKMVGYSYSIQKPSNPSAYLKIAKSVHVTYEEAVEEAIKDCLTNLI